MVGWNGTDRAIFAMRGRTAAVESERTHLHIRTLVAPLLSQRNAKGIPGKIVTAGYMTLICNSVVLVNTSASHPLRRTQYIRKKVKDCVFKSIPPMTSASSRS